MRALMIGCTLALVGAGPWPAAQAQTAKDAKAAPAASEVRYFNALGDLLGDLPVDAFIKETRQGGKLVASTLDVCYSVSTASDRKDRFVIDLKVEGEKLSGSGQSIESKTPVTVSLTRKGSKSVSFDGKITVGSHLTSVSSPDNADVDEKEFQQSQVVDDDLSETPKDFTQVSPQSVAVRVKRENFAPLVKSLKGQNVQIALDSIATDCNALRSGHQVLRLFVDPARAPALIANLKAAPGVVAAGWTSGTYDMERAVRFPAGDWSEGGKLNRDKFTAALTALAAKVMSAKPATSTWNEATGELTFTLKRPSQLAPALELTETLEITALVSPDKPGGSDRLIVWLGVPSSKTTDETAAPQLQFSEDSGGEEESTFNDDDGMIKAIAAELKGQRWDTDKASWK
ncbi:MAG: hypothetical protein ACJAVZ_003711 [Afipia broomeae]|jgi:hypothetical protein|uniref:hypothetical protein n=1 Tax=unclassified Afipia TaxID=2642050 RepID=UPI000463CC0E|nr:MULTISPECIES: hypothetical protein [unclassified Afipia]MAH70764.1 hypothetical protein [Afipia sp.]OUX60199.1 MAG: hypothetical protein CBB64_16150 [Afipia sp. TMED4]RTL82642.1 MAG: hypothetical protein EKK35_04645 [Bradyrhizobiaceae bacterium]HAO42830.1 hypothetical protein [Afipia sp.]HBR43599.1 hypothetical protein [Afipia sp.]